MAQLTEVLAERRRQHPGRVCRGRADAFPTDGSGRKLAAQTKRALVHPVFFGSAITGAGVGPLMAAIAELLPAAAGDADGPVTGSVFKIERGSSGEKIAYVRMFSGTLRTRDRLRFGAGLERHKVTRVAVFERGPAVRRDSVSAGEIGKLWGLDEVQIGDQIGQRWHRAARGHQFAAADAGVRRRRPRSRRPGTAPRRAGQIAEQDPLINVRQDDSRQETVRVALRRGPEGGHPGDAGRATSASRSRSARQRRSTSSVQSAGVAPSSFFRRDTHPFSATVGLRVEPAPTGSGITFRLDVDSARRADVHLQDRRKLYRRHDASTSAARCRRACTAGKSPAAP